FLVVDAGDIAVAVEFYAVAGIFRGALGYAEFAACRLFRCGPNVVDRVTDRWRFGYEEDLAAFQLCGDFFAIGAVDADGLWRTTGEVESGLDEILSCDVERVVDDHGDALSLR